MAKSFWKHPLTVVVTNILLVMVLYTFLRLCCFFIDRTMFPDVSFGHLMEMLRGGMRFDLSAILYLSSLYILVTLCPLPNHWRQHPRFQKTLPWLFWIPNSIGLFINTIDIGYIPFTDRRTTCTFFQEFGNDTNLGSIIGESIAHYWYLVLILILVITLLILGTRRRYTLTPTRTWVYYTRESVILILFVYFSVIGIRGGFGRYTRPITISNAMQYVNTPRECALVLNTPFTMIQSIVPARFEEKHYFTDDELPQHMNPVHSPVVTTPVTDNIVVLILESFNKEYIGFYNRDIPGYTGYTPFLDSLLAHSVTYPYSFASGRKSIDAMPSILSSIPMLIESYIVTPYSTNAVSSIADCVRQKGYRTAFFHGAPNGSMGFQAYARSAGFENYYGKDEYDGPDAFDGTWAIWDEPFLLYYARIMDTLPQPFMTAVFTASSHHPFKVPAAYRDSFPKGNLPIHQTIGYTDHALRTFFDSIRTKPWFDHTLFVLTADHTNESAMPEYSNAKGLFEIPIAFYHPQGLPATTNTVICQTDIMPSVLSYIGYAAPYIAFGEDALTATKTHPYAVNYNATVFQIFSDSLLLQYDGNQLIGAYNFQSDRCLKNNIADQIDTLQIRPMTDYLKAYIQQYIHRVMHNELTLPCEN